MSPVTGTGLIPGWELPHAASTGGKKKKKGLGDKPLKEDGVLRMKARYLAHQQDR